MTPTERALDYVGRPMLRVEDRELLLGTSEFVDDVDRPGQLHVCFIRSQAASGRILGVDAEAARSRDGVAAVITAADLPDGFVIPLRLAPNPAATQALQPALARDVVRYVGEPVAAVVAESRYLAEDAAEGVRVDIEPLPVTLDAAAATAAGVPAVHEALPNNTVSSRRVVSGDIDDVFARADMTVRERFAVQRHTALPLETRGLVAEVDRASGTLTLWGATKVKHFNRRALAELLGVPAERVRLLEVGVGGAFGVRGELYPEDLIVSWLALRLERPVKWVEDRREHFLATNHSREQQAEIELAATSDGQLMGIRLKAFVDLGAYVRTNALVLPLNTATHIAGPYRWEAICGESYGVLTNKTPAATYRGPGMFEPAFYRERALDILARRLEIDPVVLRERNLINRELLPYKLDVGSDVDPIVYGAGDFGLVWNELCRRAGYTQLRHEVDRRRLQGERVGIGTAAFVEAGARGPYEWARIVPEHDGSFTVHLGLSTVGQGLRTALCQVAADALSVPMASVRVTHASTEDIDESAGTFSSRSTVFGSGAVLGAAGDLLQRAKQAAADRCGVEAEEIELVRGGRVGLQGSSANGFCIAELDVEGFYRFEKQGRTFSMGATLAVASLDPDTGAVRVERCLVAWDVGLAINPLVVEGQLVGAAAQGIGGAVLEELPYDNSGQPMVTSFLDYAMATALDLPKVEVLVLELGRPSRAAHALPVKGAGEAGIIGVGAAVANAVADAIPTRAIELRQLPLKPDVVCRLLHGD